MSDNTLRIGLIGCGQIADAHLQQIRRVEGAEVVAVCDHEELLARQAAERFTVPMRFSNCATMIQEARPDVVHITTPVHSHAPLAIGLLDAGLHVYVEKPLTIDATEAREVMAVARENNRLVCIGHDQLFDPAWLRATQIVESGEIGEVRHVESVLGYPINGPFGRLVVSTPDHWVRRLPGGLFQNTISHPLYRITEFLDDESPEIEASWFNGHADIPFPTELRANLYGERVSGTLLFTSRVQPFQRVTRIYGTTAALEVDLDTQLIRFHQGNRYPGAFARLEAPFRQLREAGGNLKRNCGRFLRGNMHYFEGMKRLCEEFYSAIRNGTEVPVAAEEAIRVTDIMDRIFDECLGDAAESPFRIKAQTDRKSAVSAVSGSVESDAEQSSELVSNSTM